MIYLDAAATTLQKPKQVAQAVARAMRELASPGRGGYPAAMEAGNTVYACRCEAAALFGAEPEQVVFTSNATHALNLAIHSVLRPGDEAVCSGLEHNAVMRPLYASGARIAVAAAPIFDRQAAIDAFDRMVTKRTKAVVCTMVSNVFGCPLPVETIAEIAHGAKAALIVDASQAAGVLPVSLQALGADFIAMPGHKGLYGPQGTGILLCGQRAAPLLTGGTGVQSIPLVMPELLPERLEAGTLNVCGIAGLLEGIRFVRRQTPERILAHERRLIGSLVDALQAQTDLTLFTGPEQMGVLSFQVGGMDCEEAAQRLAQRGIAVRAGLHCAPLAHTIADTVRQGTVRVSVSAFNTPGQMRQFARVMARIRE